MLGLLIWTSFSWGHFRWNFFCQRTLQMELHLNLWVWTHIFTNLATSWNNDTPDWTSSSATFGHVSMKNYLEKLRHTHTMERSICGHRPTVLSANLYQSYLLTILFLTPKNRPRKYLPSLPGVYFFSKVSKVSFEFLPSNLSTLNQIFEVLNQLFYGFFFINCSKLFLNSSKF